MKRLIILFLLIMSLNACWAQQVVHDPITYLTQLEQIFNQIRDFQNQTAQLEYLVKSVELQYQSLKNIDIKSYYDLKSYVQNQYYGINNLKDRALGLNLQIGDQQYVLREFIPSEKTVRDYFEKLKEAKAKGNSIGIENASWKISNMEQVNEEFLRDLSLQIHALSYETGEQRLEKNKRILDLMNNIKSTDSLLGIQQGIGLMMAELNSSLELLIQSTNVANQLAAQQASLELLYHKQELSSFDNATPELEYSDDFYDYLNNNSNQLRVIEF